MWLPDEWLLGHSEQLKIADTVRWSEDIHKHFVLSGWRLEVNKAIPSQVLLQFPAKNAEAVREMLRVLINVSPS